MYFLRTSQILVPALFIFAALFSGTVACGSTSLPAPDNPLGAVNIVDSSGVYYEEFLLNVKGIKGIKNYDVSELPEASSSIRLIYNRTRYEARFYPSHAQAVGVGIEWARSIVGEDAKLITSEALWKEGNNDRRRCTRRNDHAGCAYAPIYNYIAVVGNMLLLCEGLEETEAFGACEALLSEARDNEET